MVGEKKKDKCNVRYERNEGKKRSEVGRRSLGSKSVVSNVARYYPVVPLNPPRGTLLSLSLSVSQMKKRRWAGV